MTRTGPLRWRTVHAPCASTGLRVTSACRAAMCPKRENAPRPLQKGPARICFSAAYVFPPLVYVSVSHMLLGFLWSTHVCVCGGCQHTMQGRCPICRAACTMLQPKRIDRMPYVTRMAVQVTLPWIEVWQSFPSASGFGVARWGCALAQSLMAFVCVTQV